MNIVAIGDPHGNVARLRRMPLKSADAILVTGDLGNATLMRNIAFGKAADTKTNQRRAYLQAYRSSLCVMKYLLQHAPVYTIYGNVESSDRETKALSKALGFKLPSLTTALKKLGVHIVNDRCFSLKSVRIGALKYFVDTNWARTFTPKNKQLLRSAARQTKKAAKTLAKWKRVDILLSHQPPYGILDRVGGRISPKSWRGKHAGSKLIADYIKRRQPAIVLCGHIHEGAGKLRKGKTDIYNLGDGRSVLFEVP